MLKKIKSKYQDRKVKRAQKKEEKQSKQASLRKSNAYEQAIIAWVAPELVHHQRGNAWKVGASVFVLAMVIYGLWSDAWTFSLAIGVAAIVYYVVNIEHPHNVEVKISDVGIKVGNRYYAYSRIKAFWIIYEPPYVSTLNIRVDGEFLADITIQLGAQHPAPVRELLLEKLPELEGQTEKLSDIFFRLFKI